MRVHCPHCQNPIEIVEEEPLAEVPCPLCGGSFSLVPDETETFKGPEVRTVGHFELVNRIGMGHFGTVWEAKDTKLDRTVAVKIPRREQLSAVDAEVFLREARAAAQLAHPGIVSVHEVGREDDTVYIVSDLVRGLTLSDWLTAHRPTHRDAAELCVKIADALDHAHEAGVVHRDLKPSNIMVDAAGEPRIMDFGLAKREAGEITMTVEGKVLGTPAYMSPEQAKGEGHHADRRSDVYSVGVILFELLTGERPFRGNTRMLLHQVVNDDAPSPRRFDSAVSRDLETICLKCLEKDAPRRYTSAQQLAEELRRFLEGKPINARPLRTIARAWRWCKRKPLVAGLSAALGILILCVAIASPLVAIREAILRDVADDRTREAELAQKETQQAYQVAEGNLQEANAAKYLSQTKTLEAYETLAMSHYNQAQVLRSAKEPDRQQRALDFLRDAGQLRSQSQEVLGQVREDPKRWGERMQRFWEPHFPTLRSEAARWLQDTSLIPIDTLSFPRRSTSSIRTIHLALTPDGKWLAYHNGQLRLSNPLQPHSIQIISRTSGKTEHVIYVSGHGWYPLTLAFAPEDNQLLVGLVGMFGGGKIELRRYSIPSGNTVETVSLVLPADMESVSFGMQMTFDQRREHVLVHGRQIRGVWNMQDGSRVRDFGTEFHPRIFTPSGDQVIGVADSNARELQFRLIDTGEVAKTLTLPADLSESYRLTATYRDEAELCISRDGKWLAAVATRSDGPSLAEPYEQLVTWDANSCKFWKTVPLQFGMSFAPLGALPRLSISADGRLIAVLNSERLFVFSIPGISLLARPRHTDAIVSAETRFRLASSALCFAETGSQLVSLITRTPVEYHGPPASDIIQLWDCATPIVPSVSKPHQANVNSVHVDPSGKLVSGSQDRKVRRWGRGEQPDWSVGYAGQGGLYRTRYGTAFDPSGRALITWFPDRLQVWDAATGQSRITFDESRYLAESPDKRYLAVTDMDTQGNSVVRIFDIGGNDWLATFPWEEVSRAAFSPDSRFLVGSGTGVHVGHISDGSTVTGKSKSQYASTSGFAFDPTGETVLFSFTKDSRSGLCLMELATGHHVVELHEHVPKYFRPETVCFSPDGDRVLWSLEHTEQSQTISSVYLWSLDQSKPNQIGSAWSSVDISKTAFVMRGNRLVVGGSKASENKSVAVTELWDITQPRLIVARAGSPVLWPDRGGRLRLCHNKEHGRLAVDIAIDDKRHRCEIWDVITGNVLAQHSGQIGGLSSNSEYLVVQGEDGYQKLIDMSSGKVHMAVTGPGRLLFSPDGRTMVKEGNDLVVYDLPGRVRRAVLASRQFPEWSRLMSAYKADPSSGDHMRRLAYASLDIQRFLGFSPDSMLLFTLKPMGNTGINVWDVVNGIRQDTIPIPIHFSAVSHSGSGFPHLAFSEDGKRMAIRVYDQDQIRLLDLEAGGIYATLPRAGHYDAVRTVDVSPNGEIVASAGDDQTICLWDAEDGRFVDVLEGYQDSIHTVRFSPDGDHLLSRDARGQLRAWNLTRTSQNQKLSVDASLLWDTRTPGQLSGTLDATGGSSSAAFSPDGKLVAAVCENGSVELRESDSGKFVRFLGIQWRDEPLDTSGLSPEVAQKERIENAHGILAERFALCQTMPLEEFVAVAEGLRRSGYRPLRFRPYRAGDAVRVAACWVRDDRDWQMAHGLTAEELRQLDETWHKKGYLPNDVVGYPGDPSARDQQRQYAAVWTERVSESDEAQMYVGVPVEQYEAACEPLKEAGLTPLTYRLWRENTADLRYSSVWWKSGKQWWALAHYLGDSAYGNKMIQERTRVAVDVFVDREAASVSAEVLYTNNLAKAEKALQTEPDNPNAKCLRARAHFGLGAHEKALEDLNPIIEKDPEFYKAYRLRARVHVCLGNGDAAREDIAAFETTVLDEGSRTYFDMIVSACLGQHDKASERLEAALEVHSDDSAFLYDVACACSLASRVIAQENPDKAEEYVNRAVALLQQSVDRGYANFQHMEADADLDPIREHPTYVEIVSKRQFRPVYSAVWNILSNRISRELHGLSPEEHLQRCQELAALGYRPASISVAWMCDSQPLVAASVWHRPIAESSLSVAFCPDGTVLATGQANGSVLLWDVATGDTIRQWETEEGGIRALEFSPSGQILATAGNDVKLWNPDTGQLLMTLDGHSQPVNTLSFSDDGELLATGSDDGTSAICSLKVLHEQLTEIGLGW